MTMTYAEASKIINVIDSLQGLDDRTPAEQETLEKLMKYRQGYALSQPRPKEVNDALKQVIRLLKK